MTDDSNDENNWRNDYPDEEEFDSIDDYDMVNAVNDLDLDGDRELSTDDGKKCIFLCFTCYSLMQEC